MHAASLASLDVDEAGSQMVSMVILDANRISLTPQLVPIKISQRMKELWSWAVAKKEVRVLRWYHMLLGPIGPLAGCALFYLLLKDYMMVVDRGTRYIALAFFVFGGVGIQLTVTTLIRLALKKKAQVEP